MMFLLLLSVLKVLLRIGLLILIITENLLVRGYGSQVAVTIHAL